MITTLDQDTLREMISSIARGNLTLIEVRSKAGNTGVALCINVPGAQESTGLRWIPIAIFDPSLITKVLPHNGQGWREFGMTVALEGECEASNIEIAPNMAPARA
jgi:hypothetical protein